MTTTRHVVIAGAGPSGLLLAALLLRQRNPSIKYKVTLIDYRQDYGAMDIETELQKHRSWMIALAGHGLQALRQIPKLYQEYALQPHVGVRLKSVSIFLGSKEMKSSVGVEEGEENEGYIVDRNFIVAAIARYLNEQHGAGEFFVKRYETMVMYVDAKNQRVLARSMTDPTHEEYLKYDLLVGADGSRSVVREALVKQEYDFEMDVGDIFQRFRAVHVVKPTTVDAASMSLLPDCLPYMNGICLPEPGNMVNVSIGTAANNFDKIPVEMKSTDPKVVATYMRENFKAFQLEDYDDFAKKWIANKRWQRTAMVHCNKYHSSNILIMGDAAHATSPSIGMGMNTALRDAQVLTELLEQHQGDLELVLPAYSQARVKEGNALSDMAVHLYCLDTTQQLLTTIGMVVRGFLHKQCPSLVQEHPQNIIGRPKYSLAEVYTVATELNLIPKQRAINDRIRQEYFEKEVGMRTREIRTTNTTTVLAFATALLAAGVAAMKWP